MIQETLRFLVWPAVFSLLLWAIALLAGCSVEGAGFTNTGQPAKPVVCKEVRPGYMRCKNVD